MKNKEKERNGELDMSIKKEIYTERRREGEEKKE